MSAGLRLLPVTVILLGALSSISPAVDARDAGRSQKALTVEAALSMRRVLGSASDAVSFSPNGTRYVLRLIHDDLERNGSWVELIAGRTDSMEGAQPVTVATLFTTSERDDDTGRLSPIHPANAELTWLADNERVVFLWNDGKSPMQLVALNVRTKQMQRLTNHPTSLSDANLTFDGSRMVYLANPGRSVAYKERMAAMYRQGFSITHGESPIDTVLAGNYDGFMPWFDMKLYVTTVPSVTPRAIQCEEINCSSIRSAGDSMSPDGRHAVILSAPVPALRAEWARYTHPTLQAAMQSNMLDWVGQIAVIDLNRATLRPLWNAPHTIWIDDTRLVWSADGSRVLVGPTFLPAQSADAAGLEGTAIAEVELASGRFWTVPVPEDLRGKVAPRRWNEDGTIVLGGKTRSVYYRKSDGKWRVSAAPRGSDVVEPEAPVRIELRQSLNSPPALYAIERATKREKLLLDVEPRLRTGYALGRVENIEWNDGAGSRWAGRLHYPVGYVQSRRYPLAIQLSGPSSRSEFSLLGSGDSRGTAFAAQAMANRGMMVLSLYSNPDAREVLAKPDEPKFIMGGVESAVAHLVEEELVDRDRVGLVGYSRTGWYAQYILTHSNFPYAAAISSDNHDKGYVQAVLRYGMGGETAIVNGGEPYGDGLKAWFESSPAFRADKIRTPLRLETASGGIPYLLQHWEMYSRLHYLKRPVELVIVPESDKAEHPLQIPTQKRFSQEGTVDWMDFWLNDHEDSDPRKAAQYERWRKLREQREALVKERLAAGSSAVAHN